MRLKLVPRSLINDSDGKQNGNSEFWENGGNASVNERAELNDHDAGTLLNSPGFRLRPLSRAPWAFGGHGRRGKPSPHCNTGIARLEIINCETGERD